MNRSYEDTEIATEALYPMGCGMAISRHALELVGPFDDRIRNYYDDVDYGIRVWRAGLRVVEHRTRGSTAASRAAHSQAARSATAPCGGGSPLERVGWAERPCSASATARRVVLKHARASELRAGRHELHSARRAARAVRGRKLRTRAGRGSSAERARLPAGPCRRPARAGAAGRGLVGGRLPGGCAPARAPTAGARRRAPRLVRPGRRWAAALRLVSAGGQRRAQLPLGDDPRGRAGVPPTAGEAPAPRLQARPGRPRRGRGRATESRQRRPGRSRVARQAWLAIHRSLGREPPAGAPAGGLRTPVQRHSRMVAPAGRDPLAGARAGERRVPRACRAAAGRTRHGPPGRRGAARQRLVRSRAERGAQLPLGGSGSEGAGESRAAGAGGPNRVPQAARRSACGEHRGAPTRRARTLSSASLQLGSGDWEEHRLELDLGPGEYMLAIRAERTWSNPDGSDPGLWAEARTLGFALSSFTFCPGR